MRVFISWSGERSRKVAELIDTWLKCVIQAAEPWISSQNLDRGSIWFNDILNELSTCNVGIICLTKENLNKPWILFEAGAIAKGIGTGNNKVCTFLVDLQPSDILDPLAQFNHTIPDKNGVKNLITTINKSLKERALKESVLSQVFETYWSDFESKFQDILNNTTNVEIVPQSKGNKHIEKLTIDNLLPELLTTVRNIDRRLFTLEQNNTSKLSGVRRLPNPETVREFIEQMEYQDSELDILRKLSEYFGVSRSFFARQFKEEIDNKVIPL